MSSPVNAEIGSAASSYEILAKLAMGGMAEIFLARGASAAGVERYVVLKRVLRHKATDQDFMRMFLDEARLAAQLQHPNIAQVYDIGKLGDSYFFTMEYVHGETVRNLLQRSFGLRRHLPIGSVLTIMAGSAAGLHHAHERKGFDGKPLGIVHRDVSPSNLMVSYEGTVKVVDFGVAKATSRDSETKSGTVKGKITYMSPEQCRGAELDRRSDLFSLGIVMWEMLTTERLFRRNSDFENMQAIVAEAVPPPSALRPDVPPELDRIVMRLLAKSQAERYQTADELHEAIEGAAVATGSALSAASLGRFMRELFGQRPEPWIELQNNDAQPEHTVTRDPIPGELGAMQPDELDMQLSVLPVLSQRMTAQEAPAVVPRPPMPTMPLRVQAEDLAATLHRDPRGVIDMQVVRATLPRPLERAPTHPPVATMMMSPAPAPLRVQTPSLTPGSGPQYPIVQSGPHSRTSYPPYQTAPAAPKRSRVLLIVVPAIVLGAVLGIAVGLGGGKKQRPVAGAAPGEPATAPRESEPRVAMQPGRAEPTPAEPTPAEPTPPAPTPPAPTPAAAAPAAPTVPSGAPPSDAFVPTVPAEAVPPPPVPTVEKPSRPEPRKPPPRARPEPQPKPKDDIPTLFKQDRFSDVVSACNASTKLVALNATACTIAACKGREASKAKRWYGSVGAAKRGTVVKECSGILPSAEPERRPSTDDRKPSKDERCRRDPMACQH